MLCSEREKLEKERNEREKESREKEKESVTREIEGVTREGGRECGEVIKSKQFPCPECRKKVTHMKRHLMSKQHGWSATKYHKYFLDREGRKQELPPKACTLYNWTGRRLDMHYQRHHHGKKTQEYREAMKLSALRSRARR